MLDKRVIERILSDQQEELALRASEKLCYRKAMEEIDLNSTQAQVVIGVRRSGKSTLCYQALERAGVKYAYVNFDDENFLNIEADAFNDILEVLYKINGEFNYILLDEIQNVEGWHLFVNRLLRRKIHVVITGSNANLLSSELATHLTGRSNEITLYPFSFEEFCEIKNVDTKAKTTQAEGLRRAAFDKYMIQGGFPELLSISNQRSYISNLVDNILKRDIEQRYKIRYKDTFEKLAHHLLNISPAIISNKDLAELFDINSPHTVGNYVGYLQESYLLLGLKKFSVKSKHRIVDLKEYAIDIALMNQRSDAFSGNNLGWRLETLVYIHLIKNCKPLKLDIYYLKTRSSECDFVICKDNKVVQAIQVSYDISSDKTRKRELKGLTSAAEMTKCENLLLLTDHVYEDTVDKGHKIAIRPVYDWALQDLKF